MSIRWKLNLSVIALIAVFLFAVAFVMHSVGENARLTREFSRMRTLSQFTADVRTDIYSHQSSVRDNPAADSEMVPAWPSSLLEDIGVQIRLAQGEGERRSWEQVFQAVTESTDSVQSEERAPRIHAWVARAEHELRKLRNLYDVREHDLIAMAARTSLKAQTAIWVACALTVLLFLIHLIMVRHWLVGPIRTLKESADIIGSGRLDHTVPLGGRDELSDLARALEAMGARLARDQAELLEARELSAIGELCTHVAHGLKNPLAAMRASAQLAERRASGSDPVQGRIRDLISQADCMNARITELFEFSRPCDLNISPITFDELANDARSQTFSLLESREIALHTTSECGGVSWLLDRRRIADSLAELICNAAYHSPPNSRVILRGTLLPSHNGTGRRLEIAVVDHGSGMPAASRKKAFDLFFTSRPQGTGMGLAMVRRVAEKHGGQVEIASEPGAGTTVTLTLCSASREPKSPTTPVATG